MIERIYFVYNTDQFIDLKGSSTNLPSSHIFIKFSGINFLNKFDGSQYGCIVTLDGS